jgi:D-sedoheptulose 7-phosphate isomerase
MITKTIFDELSILYSNYPELSVCKEDILAAHRIMENCYLNHGLIMVCGNGGSAADAQHIVGELMKSFKQEQPISEDEHRLLVNFFQAEGVHLK